MIFTSDIYVVFLLAVFAVHWLLPARARKPFIILASYAFYASWNWRYLPLLLGVSLFNWAYARWVLARVERRGVLLFGIAVNAGVLGYYKYADFFLANVRATAHALDMTWAIPTLEIALPLGISFFTFQGIAYLVDVASGDKPLEPLEDFLLFKGFWPQLIAGPIIRIHEIRAQIETKRPFVAADVAAGARRILIGFCKKLVVADSLAPAVEKVFARGAAPTGLDCVLGTVGFALEIYFDFSAYSDIAIGSARLFGFQFPENFNWPYSAATPQEFWNRWHMTLSRWIRDYVFTPLSFTFRRQPWMENLSLIGAMTICGLWHGARWTFVLWGAWHGLLLVLTRFIPRDRLPSAPGASPIVRAFGIVVTFALVNAGWVLFRAPSVHQAVGMYRAALTLRGGPHLALLDGSQAVLVLAVLAALVAASFLRGSAARLAQRLYGGGWWGIPARALSDVALLHMAIVFSGSNKPFVYFQF
jgi:D-alanyl-lipoteichoic acid acyltransferase DltB (MBOAT superfamily)